MNIIQVGKKYRTRDGNIATITENVSEMEQVYPIKGFVTTHTGEKVRRICMWTHYGSYVRERESGFDLIEMIEP